MFPLNAAASQSVPPDAAPAIGMFSVATDAVGSGGGDASPAEVAELTADFVSA